MTKVSVYIDGFNLYHLLSQYNATTRTKPFNKYKWLDLVKLANCFLLSKDCLVDIYFFTALPTWKNSDKHKLYIKALQVMGVAVKEGRFQKVTRRCQLCGKDYVTHEEKKTDVNIAIQLLSDAYNDSYEKAMIISGDSDLIPAIEAVKSQFPSKRICVVVPNKGFNIMSASDEKYRIKEKHLAQSQLANPIKTSNGELYRPQDWSK